MWRAVNHREIQTLYKRFRSLDKRHKGYLSEDELSEHPRAGHLAARLARRAGVPESELRGLLSRAGGVQRPRDPGGEAGFHVQGAPRRIRPSRPASVFPRKDAPRATTHASFLSRLSKVYDVDRDGLISLSDLETIVKHLVGSSLNEQVAELITRAMAELAQI